MIDNDMLTRTNRIVTNVTVLPGIDSGLMMKLAHDTITAIVVGR